MRRRNGCYLALCYLALQNFALAAPKFTALGRLRGRNSPPTEEAPIRSADVHTRELETMFENTATGLHVLHQTALQVSEATEPVEKTVVLEIIEDGKLVGEEEVVEDIDEEESVDQEEVHFVTKEEPKGLYVGGKSSKAKTSPGKVKGGRAKSAEPETLGPEALQEEQTDEIDAAVPEDTKDKEQKEEEVKVEMPSPAPKDLKDEEPKEGPEALQEEQTDEVDAAVPEDTKDKEQKEEEVKVDMPSAAPEDLKDEEPKEEEKEKTEMPKEEEIKDEQPQKEEEAKEGGEKSTVDEQVVDVVGPTEPAASSGEASIAQGRQSASAPQITEIKVGFQFQLSDQQRIAAVNDYKDLATATSQACDYIFSHYFMDIEEVQFLSTDRLAIYEVAGPNYAVFTVAAYFDGASSLPDQQQLTDIVTVSLLSKSTYYDYFIFLLGSLDEKNAFHYTTAIELYSITSGLTGPGEQWGPHAHSSGRLFKVAIPLVVLFLVSVFVALFYMSWVESHQTFPEDDEILKDNDDRRSLPLIDGDHTLNSKGYSSLTERHSFSDDSASISESSARFVEEMTPPKNLKKKVKVSPRVLYRTYNPGDFSSRVDFEEVSLQDGDQEPEQRILQLPKKPDPEEGEEKKVSLSKLMDDFAAALNSAPIHVFSSTGADQFSKTAKKDAPAGSPQLGDKYFDVPGAESEAALAQLSPINMTPSSANDVILRRETRSKNGGPCTTELDPPSSLPNRPNSVADEATGQEVTSPKMSPKTVLQSVNHASQTTNRMQQTVSQLTTPDAKSCFDDEYEEEVIEEEDEDEVVSVDEEEVSENEEERVLGDTDSDDDLAAIEEALWGTRTPQPQQYQSGLAVIGEGDMGGVPGLTTPAQAIGDSTVPSPKPTPPLPPRKAREFWEKKTAKQETVRELWEKRTKQNPKK